VRDDDERRLEVGPEREQVVLQIDAGEGADRLILLSIGTAINVRMPATSTPSTATGSRGRGPSPPARWASWVGRGVPIATSSPRAVLADPTLQTRLAELAGEPMPMTPTEFGKLVADEAEKWGKVIRAANIKPQSDIAEFTELDPKPILASHPIG